MKRIAVATDLSERSDRAVERALSLCAQLNAECTVISIVDESLPHDIASDTRASIETKLRAILDARKAPDAQIDVRIGDVVPGVLGIATEANADLLVLGIHRRREFMDAFRQTTMERIVALSTLPVLLAHDPVTGPYTQVLAAVNFSPACAAAVSHAARIAAGADIAKVHALHVPFAGLTGGTASTMEKAVRREAEELAEQWRTHYGVPGEGAEIVTGSFHMVLDRSLRKYAPDLLALGAHTRTGPGFHRLGGLAAELMRDPPVDLLVTRASA